jgi:hypothetical protein
MKRFLPTMFGFIILSVLIHALTGGATLVGSLAMLFVGLAAMNSLSSAMFGVSVLSNGWGRNPNDVVGYGLSNLLAPVTSPLAALGNLAAHPSWGNAAHLLASPFEGIGNAFGIGNPNAGWIGQHHSNPNQSAMPQPPGAAAYLPAPVPSLGAGLTQAHGNPLSARAIVSYMGLGTAQWVVGSALTQSLTPEPQAPFVGNRMIIVAKYSGASTAGIQINITSPLTVSGVPQTPAPNVPAPIEMFAQDATYSSLQIQIASAGTAIAIGFTASALPTGTDLVNLSAGLYGYWLR